MYCVGELPCITEVQQKCKCQVPRVRGARSYHKSMLLVAEFRGKNSTGPWKTTRQRKRVAYQPPFQFILSVQGFKIFFTCNNILNMGSPEYKFNIP